MKTQRAGLTIPVGPAPFLLLLVKLTLISIGAELDAREPRRRPPHLLTDRLQAHIRAAFDNQLIMHMCTDRQMSQRLHGVAEDIPADTLDTIFYKL